MSLEERQQTVRATIAWSEALLNNLGVETRRRGDVAQAWALSLEQAIAAALAST